MSYNRDEGVAVVIASLLALGIVCVSKYLLRFSSLDFLSVPFGGAPDPVS